MTPYDVTVTVRVRFATGRADARKSVLRELLEAFDENDVIAVRVEKAKQPMVRP